MAERSENAAGDMMSNIMDAIAENLPNKKSVRFDDGEGSISDQARKLFGGGGQGGKKSVHHVLGGGKSADVLLWRNKKISSSVLGAATLAWVLFEWLDYHLLTIASFALVLGMAVQLAWSALASNVPRLEVPEEVLADAGRAAGAQVNRALGALQDISCGRDLRRFLIVIAVFFAAAVVGSFCNLLTVIYIGNAGCREPVMISLDHLVSDNLSLKIHDVTDCVSFSNRSLLDALGVFSSFCKIV